MMHRTCICVLLVVAVSPSVVGQLQLQDGVPSLATATPQVPEEMALQSSRPSSTPSVDTSQKTLPLTKAQNGNEICQSNNTRPIPCSSLRSPFYKISINESISCRFACFYNPLQMSPLRLEAHLQYPHPMKSPTFVSVQQQFYISSWTLPIIFPIMGEDQKFTSMEILLCPPANISEEMVEFLISARGPDMKLLQITLSNVSFILQKQVNVSVKVSPVSPWYKRYQWAPYEESVLVTAASDSDVCGLMVLQNAKCPVSSEVAGLIDRGRYQTFTRQAGMVARRAEFPEGVHVIVISLPDDDACILNPLAHNKTTNRKKTVVLEVYDHATIAATWYIFLLTAAIVTTVVIVVSVVLAVSIKRTLSRYLEQDEDGRPILGESCEGPLYQVEVGGVLVMEAGQNSAHNLAPGMGNGLSYNDLGHERGGLGQAADDGAGGTRRRGPMELENSEPGQALPGGGQVAVPASTVLRHTTYAPTQEQALRIDGSFNPQFVWWWKSMAVYEARTAEAQVSEIGFQNSLMIMGVFAALPIFELLRSYLGVVLHHGKEDQCFWNSRCLTAFGYLLDFTRVFSNFSFILLGVAFVVIVRKHNALTNNILANLSTENSVGVSHHYGLYVSLGYSLIMQGVMSALYHTCPNSITIKFDMMFMYVMMAVAVVTIWGLRHGDVTHHVYPTVFAVGLTLIVAEARMWLSRAWFWGLVSTVYSILLISNTVFMSIYGIWSFSPSNLWKAWGGWKTVVQKVKDVLEEQNTTISRPMQVVRVVVGMGNNVALMVYGILGDPNFFYFILIVCLVNMILYFANYVVTKKFTFQEKGTVHAWVCLALSCVLWVIAITFFFQQRTDSEDSPAASRAKNTPCDFLLVYDEHDIWHFTSSFALFFFFVALLTMDDDLFSESAKEIRVV